MKKLTILFSLLCACSGTKQVPTDSIVKTDGHYGACVAKPEGLAYPACFAFYGTTTKEDAKAILAEQCVKFLAGTPVESCGKEYVEFYCQQPMEKVPDMFLRSYTHISEGISESEARTSCTARGKTPGP